MSTLPKTLLVPTDFSAGATAALAYAIELAKVLDAEIVVLNAWELPPVGFPDGALLATSDLSQRMSEGAREGVDRAVRENAGAGVKLQGITRQNDPWRAIVEAAAEVGAGLIVMGTHGRRGLPRALLGSVAEKVVRMAACPVLTVHASDTKHD
jgi:nucleotide-binding universal stress UspA family protein